MRLLTILFFAFVMFSCKSENVVETVPDFERELIGFGMAGTHRDSLVGYWEFNPFPFDEWHFQNIAERRITTRFLQDTLLICNGNLVYSEREKYNGFMFDPANSKYKVCR